MKRKQLGNSHLSVTPIGLGLAALGRPGYINLGHGDDLNYDHDVTAMEAQAHRVLDSAWDAGIRYFDAARSYGKERFIGRDVGCVGGTCRKLLAHAQPIGLELRIAF